MKGDEWEVICFEFNGLHLMFQHAMKQKGKETWYHVLKGYRKLRSKRRVLQKFCMKILDIRQFKFGTPPQYAEI